MQSNISQILLQQKIDSNIINQLSLYINDLNIESIYSNPDILIISNTNKQSIGIEQTQNIKSYISRKPFSNPYNIVIIENADTMTTQAQNNILKILEEPNETSVIFLLTKSPNKLLKTIESRCIIFPIHDQKKEVTQISFLDKNTLQKINYIKNLQKSISEDKLNKQDIIFNFLKNLAFENSKLLSKENYHVCKHNNDIINDLYNMNKYNINQKIFFDYIILNLI